jgi:hypothetical protein
MGNDSNYGFILECVDPLTGCPDSVVPLTVEESNLSELSSILRIQSDTLRGPCECRVPLDAVGMLRKRYSLQLGQDQGWRLRSRVEVDDLSYPVHTNRELALMLRGHKPLAVFQTPYPHDEQAPGIPEAAFAPYVTSRRFAMREYVIPSSRLSFGVPAELDGIRVVLYATKDEEWRIDAYIMLEEAAARAGWSEAVIRMEGRLLGYEAWQIDEYIGLIHLKRASRDKRKP